MKTNAIEICALGVLMLVGCDRLEQVVDLGHRAQEETKRERDRQVQAEERLTAIQAERDSLNALIVGKLAVLSNRVTEADAALRALHADRLAFSRELGATPNGDRDINGVGLERALASPVVNELAMKYLHMDFSVARGEYAEALAKARENEAEYRRTIKELDQTFDGLVDPNPQKGQSVRQRKAIADLTCEHEKLERRRTKLMRETIPSGDVYRHKRDEHDRELRDIGYRQRELEHMIDRLKTGDERERQDTARISKRTREEALSERNRAIDKLKRENMNKTSVLKTVQSYTEKTLYRLEKAFVDRAAALDEQKRKSKEGCLTLQGIRESVPKLSADGLRKLQGQVLAL